MPRVWSYCAADWQQATEAAGGVAAVTSPPYSAGNVVLEAVDVLYLNLHGFADQANFYGQVAGIVGPTALTPAQVAGRDWTGTVVFAEVCFSAKDGGGPIARAFLANGARAFVGSTTEAYGRVRRTFWDGEADRLMWLFRHALRHKDRPAAALALAKRWLTVLSFPLDADDRQTLESFVCLENDLHA